MKPLLIAIIIMCLPQFVWAGSQANQPIKFEPETIQTFAKDVEKYAAAKGARAFIIARVGRPEEDLPKRVKFTHTAIAIYSQITLESGEKVNGYAIHNLYQDADNLDRSSLVTDYPIDFFWGAQAMKAGILIPTKDVQLGLIDLIQTGDNKRLHNPKYSVLANPMTSRYQNCTEHTLDLLNAAIYQTTDIERLKANSRAYFTPQRIRKSPLMMGLGSMFMKGVTTRDHKGKVATATYGSLVNYLEKYKLIKHHAVLTESSFTENGA